MRSISISNKPLVRARALSLVFAADVHRPWTLREAFTRVLRDPVGILLGTRDRITVARDLHFEILRGERVGILGVNGAGKTSLCRCLAGIYRPTAGSVEVRGEVRAIFGVGTGILPELTGRENARLLCRFLYPRVSDSKELDALVEEALEFSELGEFVDVPYRLYSTGMQSRLCLSIASARHCDVLVLDEVFDGADAFFREKISGRVLSLIEASGAVVFVSHSDDQIRRVCNRVIVLRDGRIAFDGGVEEGIAAYRAAGARPPGAAASRRLE